VHHEGEPCPALVVRAGEPVIGFTFSFHLAAERHKFWLELKAAHFHAAEIGNTVIAQTEDIVAIDDIFKRTVDHTMGTHANCRRFTDGELENFEALNKDAFKS
jgi:hypothetical protein